MYGFVDVTHSDNRCLGYLINDGQQKFYQKVYSVALLVCLFSKFIWKHFLFLKTCFKLASGPVTGSVWRILDRSLVNQSATFSWVPDRKKIIHFISSATHVYIITWFTWIACLLKNSDKDKQFLYQYNIVTIFTGFRSYKTETTV